MASKIDPPISVLDGVTAATSGKAQLVADFRHILLDLDTEDSANMTLKIQGSNQEEQPDWDAAQGPDNQWDYLAIRDLEDKSTIDGDTGISLAGSDDNRQFEVETNKIRWVNAVITSYTAGTIHLKLSARTN